MNADRAGTCEVCPESVSSCDSRDSSWPWMSSSISCRKMAFHHCEFSDVCWVSSTWRKLYRSHRRCSVFHPCAISRVSVAAMDGQRTWSRSSRWEYYGNFWSFATCRRSSVESPGDTWGRLSICRVNAMNLRDVTIWWIFYSWVHSSLTNPKVVNFRPSFEHFWVNEID